MPEWAAIIIAWCAGAVVVGGLITKAARPLLRFFRGLSQLVREWNGVATVLDAAGNVKTEGVPSMAVRLDKLEKKVETIHHEVRPNGGGSMNDALKRVEAAGIETTKKLEESDLKQAKMAEKLDRLDARYGHTRPRDDN